MRVCRSGLEFSGSTDALRVAPPSVLARTVIAVGAGMAPAFPLAAITATATDASEVQSAVTSPASSPVRPGSSSAAPTGDSAAVATSPGSTSDAPSSSTGRGPWLTTGTSTRSVTCACQAVAKPSEARPGIPGGSGAARSTSRPAIRRSVTCRWYAAVAVAPTPARSRPRGEQ